MFAMNFERFCEIDIITIKSIGTRIALNRSMRALQKTTIIVAGIAAILASPVATEAKAIRELGAISSPTPYDRHMSEVRKVLNEVNPRETTEMKRVTGLLREARRFRYVHRTAYNPLTPQETARRRAGDCKDKSLWLLKELNTGDAHFVIGRMSGASRVNHAWLYWNHDGEWFILDPTHNTRPIKVSSLRRGNYVPLYSYSVTGSSRHNQTIAMNAYRGNRVAQADSRVADPAAAPVVAATTTRVARVAEKPAIAEKVVRSDDRRSEQAAFANRMARLDRMHRSAL